MESVILTMETEPYGGSKMSSTADDFTHSITVAQTNIKVRLGFLRKVYGILSAQLGLTIVVAGVFMNTPWIKTFVQHRPEILFVALLMSIGCLIALMFKRKESPANFYLLFAFTLMEAYTLGTLVTFFDKMVVLQAFGMTVATTIALTMYTFQSKKDYSSWGAGLFTVLWILIVAGFMQMFFHSELLEMAYAVAGAVLFSAFIVYDTHMLMHKMSAEEYIIASINLYLDIINLFIHILKILEALKRN